MFSYIHSSTYPLQNTTFFAWVLSESACRWSSRNGLRAQTCLYLMPAQIFCVTETRRQPSILTNQNDTQWLHRRQKLQWDCGLFETLILMYTGWTSKREAVLETRFEILIRFRKKRDGFGPSSHYLKRRCSAGRWDFVTKTWSHCRCLKQQRQQRIGLGVAVVNLGLEKGTNACDCNTVRLIGETWLTMCELRKCWAPAPRFRQGSWCRRIRSRRRLWHAQTALACTWARSLWPWAIRLPP